MRQAKELQFGELKSLTLEGAPQGPCVVLFHGYGADASDLLPLADYFGLSKNVTWVFPNAPLEVIIAPGFYGRAWFPIDNKRLEESLMRGEPVDLSNTTPSGIEGARKKAASLYQDLLKEHKQVVIGGFSQGAMLSTELAVSQDKKPAGLVLMSGTLICHDRWKELAPSCKNLPFVQTHGKNDALLGYEYAEKLFSLLSDAGLNGEFYAFNGGHEIPPKALEKIGGFLRRVVRA